jgi:hypothetical protein
MPELDLKGLYDDEVKEFAKNIDDPEQAGFEKSIFSMGYAMAVRHCIDRLQEMHYGFNGESWEECECGLSDAIGDLMDEFDLVDQEIDELCEETFGEETDEEIDEEDGKKETGS